MEKVQEQNQPFRRGSFSKTFVKLRGFRVVTQIANTLVSTAVGAEYHPGADHLRSHED